MSEIQISLAAARVNAHMTQDEVASKMKVSNKTVVNWESGKTAISASALFDLSELYGIPINNIRLPKQST